MIPGPRPSKGHDRLDGGRGADALRSVRATLPPETAGASEPVDTAPDVCGRPPVVLAHSSRGWSVLSPAGTDPVDGLVEGLTLADLIAEEFGILPEPDRTARRSARGPAESADDASADPVDARVAALERTVAQLEHALAARVSTERAIGVLAERHGVTPRSAFETLRREARGQGRPVAELAREVLDGIDPGPDGGADSDDAVVHAALAPVPQLPRLRTGDPQATAAADGRS